MIIRLYDYIDIYYTDVTVPTKYVTYTYLKKKKRERKLYREQLYYLPIKPNIKK